MVSSVRNLFTLGFSSVVSCQIKVHLLVFADFAGRCGHEDGHNLSGRGDVLAFAASFRPDPLAVGREVDPQHPSLPSFADALHEREEQTRTGDCGYTKYGTFYVRIIQPALYVGQRGRRQKQQMGKKKKKKLGLNYTPTPYHCWLSTALAWRGLTGANAIQGLDLHNPELEVYTRQ